jgi:hypothetical protein
MDPKNVNARRRFSIRLIVFKSSERGDGLIERDALAEKIGSDERFFRTFQIGRAHV